MVSLLPLCDRKRGRFTASHGAPMGRDPQSGGRRIQTQRCGPEARHRAEPQPSLRAVAAAGGGQLLSNRSSLGQVLAYLACILIALVLSLCWMFMSSLLMRMLSLMMLLPAGADRPGRMGCAGQRAAAPGGAPSLDQGTRQRDDAEECAGLLGRCVLAAHVLGASLDVLIKARLHRLARWI